MPTKMVTCSKDKTVLVAVYVETPRKRTFSSNHNHHHHHHLHLHQPKHGGGGSNRRAQLLDYSRHLRESARSGPSPKPVSSSNQQPMKQITAVGSKPKHGKVPACFGNCKIAIPSFLRSLATPQAKKQRKTTMKKKTCESESTATKMKSVMKRLHVQKKGGILSKLLAALQKQR